MSLVITRGLGEQYLLTKFDKDSEAFVTIKPATVAETASRDELWAKQTRTYNTGTPDSVEVKTESTFSQRQALEVYLTLVDCNIKYQEVGPTGESEGDPIALFTIGRKPNGEPYLAMEREPFLVNWGRLPAEVAEEIHEKVLLKNPQWDMFQRQ